MPPLSPLSLGCSIAIISFVGSFALGQDEKPSGVAGSSLNSEEDAGVVPKLKIARKDLSAFLSDETILAAHRVGEEKEVRFEGVFTVGADVSRFAFVWDPVTCRLLGVLDLDPPKVEPAPKSASEKDSDDVDGSDTEKSSDDAPSETPPTSPFFLAASGPALLSSTAGGSGESSFFGVRLVEGKPEFLYEQGSLLIEERLWLENGGETLQQHFALRDMDSSLVIKVPEGWRERITADRGEWKELTLTVPKEEAGELQLTYRLSERSEENTETEEEEE